jgi:hypothetical protein
VDGEDLFGSDALRGLLARAAAAACRRAGRRLHRGDAAIRKIICAGVVVSWNRQPEKGMSLKEVEAALGPAATVSNHDADGLEARERTYNVGERQVVARFVGDSVFT